MSKRATAKEQLSVYLPPEDKRKLVEFCKKHHGANQSTVIVNALELLYKQEEHQ